jgi:thioredoxin 1
MKVVEKYSKGYCLLDFYTVNCLPCQMMNPIIDELSRKWPEITFYKVDCDGEPMVAKEFQIMSVPTLVLLHDGKVVKRFDGFAPEGMISQILRKLIK